MLRAGGGIGPLTATHAAADLAQGTLVRILPEWSHGFGALYVVYPAARHVPRKVAALRDFLVEACSPRGK
jgi:DNA-binding transcriptional LysR family regulator